MLAFLPWPPIIQYQTDEHTITISTRCDRQTSHKGYFWPFLNVLNPALKMEILRMPRCQRNWLNYPSIFHCNTVCFFTFVKFYDDVFQEVVEIIDFWKKFWEGMRDAFYDGWLLGIFDKNLNLLTQEEMLIKNSKKSCYFGFLVGLFCLSCFYF